jgi:hypothetical protein
VWLILAGIVVVAAIVGIILTSDKDDKEQSWDRKFNEEVSNIDVDLGPETQPPAFEFHLNENPPHFSMILCIGQSNDERVQEDSWNIFFNEVRKYGGLQGYKPNFTDLVTTDGAHLTRVMMFVDLYEGTGPDSATDKARKVANVMREFSPCK